MKKDTTLLAILVFAFILRLITINQSLWLDEAINVNAARNLPFWQYVTGYSIGDFHPPGHFAVLWIWSHLFGFSELAVRFPSILFGLGAVFYTYLIGKKFFNQRTGTLAALFLAIAPLHVYYSQEARMYSMATFFGVMSFYFFFNIVEGKEKRFLPYSLSLLGLLYSDYLVYFVVPVQFLLGLFLYPAQFRTILKGLMLGGISLLPWLTVFPTQLQSGQSTAENVPGWKKVVGGGSFKNLALVFIKTIIGRISIVDKFVYAAILIPMGIMYGIIGLNSLHNWPEDYRKKIVLLSWVFVPLGLAFFISFAVPVLSYFRMIFILPGIYLLLALGIAQFPKKIGYLAIFFIMSVSLISLSVYYLNPKFQREDWKGVIQFTRTLDPKNSILLFEDSNLPAPFVYYDSQFIPASAGIAHFPAESINDIIDIEKITAGRKRVYLVDYLVEISDPNRFIDKKLVGLGYEVIDVHDFHGVGLIYEFSR